MNFHAVVFRPFSDISGVFQKWMEKCNDFMVVEHPADGKTKRIHCHVLMVGCSVKKEQFRRYYHNFGFTDDHWITDKVIAGEFKGEPISRQDTAKYMIKGKHLVLLSKNFSNQEVEDLRNAWVSRQIDRPPKGTIEPPPKVNWSSLLDEMKVEVKRYETRHDLRIVINIRQVADLVTRVLRRHNVKFGIYQVREFMSAIMCDDLLLKGQFLDKVCEGFEVREK